jgi:hypothetical protein
VKFILLILAVMFLGATLLSIVGAAVEIEVVVWRAVGK